MSRNELDISLGRLLGDGKKFSELIPDLDHCIETVAKREHAAVLKQLLTPGQENEELEKRLEILRLFLETVAAVFFAGMLIASCQRPMT